MTQPIPDWRNLANGREIPTETYSDQPYLVKTNDGAWLCCLTTGAGREGQPGQHVVTMRSTDQGKTWEPPVAVEPADGPEASYAVMLKTPFGRVYCFYNHNTDNVRWVKADSPPYKDGKCFRVDSLGHYVFKYSDDHGRTWSAKRYDIPVREFALDRENADGGKLRYFWNVGRPFIHDGVAYCSLHKVGGFGAGFFTRSEGVLLRSPNLLTETDPEKVEWETLPEGQVGLRTPPGGGPIAEEQSYAVLSDGSFFAVYRTVDGHPACSYSRDAGRTWTTPEYLRFASGRLVKHPRAANFVWKLSDGKYLYWFHNHGGRGYDGRNPAWLCAGREVDASDGRRIEWSEPEVVLYDDDPFVRMSYPDLLEEDGELFLTETQKDVARVHRLAPAFVERLLGQFEAKTVARDGLLLEATGEALAETIKLPNLPDFTTRDSRRADHGTRDWRAGFTLEAWLETEALGKWRRLLDSLTDEGRGLSLEAGPKGELRLQMGDGQTRCVWVSEPGLLRAGATQHIAALIDGGPKLISFVVDGRFADGGTHQQYGWGRFSPHFRSADGNPTAQVTPEGGARLRSLRVYGRALMVSEVVGNWRAGRP